MRKQLFSAAAVCAVSFMVAAVSFGQWKTEEHFPNVSIKNFGQMDARFYRGGQPDKDEIKALADMGIKTVINLRDDPKDWEKELVESFGMKYVHIPMSDKTYPPEGAAEEFMGSSRTLTPGIFSSIAGAASTARERWVLYTGSTTMDGTTGRSMTR
ncbi:MAG TPA: hypothetical protein VMM38_12630 [Aridibacter sp.]|nr:hypothetical protein [Aridibacter sp.]